ncbi:MAG: hypothetical protein ACN4GT_13660 [Gammaproteobacteria bacterium]
MNRIVPHTHRAAPHPRSVDLTPRVPWLRKIFVNLLLLVAMLGTAFALGIVTSLIREPGCMLCGSRVAFALWLIAGFALQPPYWVTGLLRRRQVEAWAAGFAAGVFVYLLVEFAAFLIVNYGSLALASGVRQWSDVAGFTVAFLVAVRSVRRASCQEDASPLHHTGRFSSRD